MTNKDKSPAVLEAEKRGKQRAKRTLQAEQRGKERAKRTLARLGTIKIGTNRKPHKPSGESFLFFVEKTQQNQSSNKSKNPPSASKEK
jgi:hypothetical protein